MVPTYRTVTTTAVESYSCAIPGVELNAIQTGEGFGPNTMRTAVLGDATIAMGSVRIPVRGHMTLSDDTLLVVTVSSAPPGTRWCGYDLEPGSTLLYGPESEHTAVSPAGVEYTAVFLHKRSIEETADKVPMPLRIPPRGSVRLLHPSSAHRSLTAVLRATDDEDPSTLWRDVRHSLASELSGDGGNRRPERTSIRESRRIVRSCLEFVNDTGGTPSIAELCAVAFASERRLRKAFVDAFGVPSTTYFRDQKLNEARTRLRAASSRQTVMEVATDIGIQNGGRFAQRYFDLFGELPSTTLQTAP